MRSIADYSDDDLLRLLKKTVGTAGGKDRAEMISAELATRGVDEDTRESFFASLIPTTTNAPTT